VKTGHRQGVYDNWEDAEASIKGHVGPQWKTFKTIMAAEAFVEGKDGGSFRVNQVGVGKTVEGGVGNEIQGVGC
jgi:viroplasmin and RNaseH domain-containing protein